MIEGSIQEEDITIINIYAPNIGVPRYGNNMVQYGNNKANANKYERGN